MAFLDGDLRAIEAVYLRSVFIREICVVEVDDAAAGESKTVAAVLPDMEQLKQRKIANIGDLLRFELEGQSIELPVERRLSGYQIWFEPFPRTDSGALDREAIRRRFLGKPHVPAPVVDRAFAASLNPAASGVIEVVARRAKRGVIDPHANLEIDLGLDSLDRLELFVELEQRCGVRVPDQQAHDVLTAGDLIEAFASDTVDRASTLQDPWRLMLGGHRAEAPPDVQWVLRPGGAGMATVYALLRAARLVLPRILVTGREHLPSSGPYLLCPNHQSYVDPFFVSSTLPYRLVRQIFAVGAAEYFESPLTKWLARQTKLVPVDPDANLMGAMRAAAIGLRHGKILLMFPEGERSIDGRVKQFKKGAAVLSQQLDVPIVPVAVRGLFELWPRNRPMNWQAVAPWSDHHVRIAFGTPMRFAPQLTPAEATAQLQARVNALWDALGRSPEPR